MKKAAQSIKPHVEIEFKRAAWVSRASSSLCASPYPRSCPKYHELEPEGVTEWQTEESNIRLESRGASLPSTARISQVEVLVGAERFEL